MPCRFASGRKHGQGLAAAVCLLLVLGWWFAPCAAQPALAKSGASPPEIDRLLHSGGYLVARADEIVSSRNADQLLIPASIWKIGTSLAAISLLGQEYRFRTSFYQNDRGDLYIQGQGDPLLISEEIETMVARLAGKVERINDILLDDSAFELSGPPDGAGTSLNPYDAVNSALAANFNTVHLQVGPDHSIRSAEPQTPTLPLMRRLGAGLQPGSYRINIGHDPELVLQHTGELFRAFQQKLQIPGQGRVGRAPVPPGLSPVYVHSSSLPLPRVVSSLLLYSNNFIANQLFLACGSRRFGPPATWEKGRRALREFLQRKLQLTELEIRVQEGSGLSRANRLTPRAMLKILNAFKPFGSLLPEHQGQLVKSGTLTGVYSYAGYFRDGSDLDGFVLILNQEENHRDRLLEQLEAIHRAGIKSVASQAAP